MADLIDRAKAIKAIEDMQDCYNGFSSTFDKAHIIEVVEEVPTAEPQWIPCSKQMPVEEVAVWVTIAGHDLIIRKDGETIEDAIDRISKTRWVTQGFFGSDGWYGADGYPMMVRPIAWMPLEKPKAYEGEV